MPAAQEAIKGTIESISRPYGGGWRFASVQPPGSDPVNVVGVISNDLQAGDVCIFQGRYRDHEKYGRQFHATAAQLEIPKDVRGIQDYLDRHFKWVGPTIARRLVEEFGENLFRVMKDTPDRLTRIQGITPARAREICDEYRAIECDREFDVFFATHGITLNMRNRLLERYGEKEQAVRVIKDNPYTLADEIWGIGFKRADQIALSIGIGKESGRRLRAGVAWVLQEASESDGHCCLPFEELVERAQKILQGGKEKISRIVSSLVQEKRLIDVEGEIYRPDIFKAETFVAEKLRALASAHHEEMMREITEDELRKMDEDQRRGLELALSSKVCAITGGPGVGKTYLVNLIIQALGDRKIELAAPTGKAAKRMSEVSGRPARTIHRLLEFNPILGEFQVNAENPLDCDTLIVDETSMIDIHLMAVLMAAVTTKTQVIFVGDADQLPSVGPGRLLADMIQSETIPVARLKTLHRQAAASLINVNAQRINAGEKLDLSTAQGDFWFCPEETTEKIPGLIVRACLAIPQRFKKSENPDVNLTFDDIQVLCPQKRGAIGTEELNKLLRPVLNPNGEKLAGSTFCTGDRVIQMRNNYRLEVFNGDVGRVLGADREHLFVEFDDLQGKREVAYSHIDAGELQLAYALTVHKSQGSEFPAVIIPVHTTNYLMLRRNLLYTGITRGKKLVLLIGTLKAVNLAIRTVDADKRYSNLERWIREGTTYE